MGLHDAANYVLFANPLSKGVVSSVWGLGRMTGLVASNGSRSQVVQPLVLPALHALCGTGGRPFIRIAAISGASALAIHWYYWHMQKRSTKGAKGVGYYDVEDIYSPDTFGFGNASDTMFATVNMVHYLHSVALLSVPLCRTPVFTGTMFVIGSILYSGSGYYQAFGGNLDVRMISASGCGCLFIAWSSMLC